MNKKLQNYVEKAVILTSLGPTDTDFNVHTLTQIYENLVKLIIEECGKVADDTQLVNRGLSVSFAIKQHFGIE